MQTKTNMTRRVNRDRKSRRAVHQCLKAIRKNPADFKPGRYRIIVDMLVKSLSY